MVASQPLLALNQVTKHYQEGEDVLSGVDLVLEPGTSLSVVGPSGCGKSTLLNLMGALDRPSSGQVLLDGEDIASLDDGQLAAVRNRKLGFVFQLHHLLPQCTVLENVLLPLLPRSRAEQDEGQERALGLLQRVGLHDTLSRLPGALSGGERQRVAVVRALVGKPVLLLADEPTGSLDRAHAAALVDLMLELNREQGVSLVMVTHARHLAERMAQTLALRNGRLVPAAREDHS